MLLIEGVTKHFTRGAVSTVALQDVDLAIPAGEFVTIVGPSGCGKSSLLTLVAGLAPPTVGRISLDGAEIDGVSRDVGFITQQDNLFPWRTLIENVAFPLELQGLGTKARLAEARSWIRRVGLAGFEDAYPHQLSGGMRQRGNIIRTLIYGPRLILMDEPFGPLDAQTRLVLQALLLSIWETQRPTVLFVTHDLTEAIGLADRVVLMSARPGRIVRADPVAIERPRDIFHINTLPEFRTLYNAIWRELETQMAGVVEDVH